MNPDIIAAMPRFLDVLGLSEEPMGIFYTDKPPGDGLHPKPMDLPTREKEMENQIDWQAVFGGFSCAMGHIWRARRKKTAAWFSAEHFGCPGGAFWLGFMKPQTETIINYVSSGIPGGQRGEWYCESPDKLRRMFDQIDPRPAPKPICVVKPLSLFSENEEPEIAAFFGRPESMAGLHQLATFITDDPEAVASPWGAACTGLVTWPLKYAGRGEDRAVLGGWDPSARKFFKTDELSISLPTEMFASMIERYEQSFLMTRTWANTRKKIDRSKRAWGERKKAGPDS